MIEQLPASGTDVTLPSSIGHDLKTPLTAVVAAAEALAVEHGASQSAMTLQSEARRLRQVFDDLVGMTRIEAGAVVVKRRRACPLAAVDRRAADLAAGRGRPAYAAPHPD